MVRGADSPPGVGESGGLGLAQPGERLERARAEERNRVRVRRRKPTSFMVVGSEERQQSSRERK